MARLKRFCPVGIAQHVIQRGNNRQVCFNGDDAPAFYNSAQITHQGVIVKDVQSGLEFHVQFNRNDRTTDPGVGTAFLLNWSN
jgi:REP element-mobilizing transposase RayT